MRLVESFRLQRTKRQTVERVTPYVATSFFSIALASKHKTTCRLYATNVHFSLSTAAAVDWTANWIKKAGNIHGGIIPVLQLIKIYKLYDTTETATMHIHIFQR